MSHVVQSPNISYTTTYYITDSSVTFRTIGGHLVEDSVGNLYVKSKDGSLTVIKKHNLTEDDIERLLFSLQVVDFHRYAHRIVLNILSYNELTSIFKSKLLKRDFEDREGEPKLRQL